MVTFLPPNLKQHIHTQLSRRKRQEGDSRFAPCPLQGRTLQGHGRPSACPQGSPAVVELGVLPSGDTPPLQDRTGQDTPLKAALCRGFCYSFPEQEQQEHSAPWGKAALLSGGTTCPVTAVRQSQLGARAASAVTVSPPWGYLPSACTQQHPMGQRRKPNIQQHVAFSRDLGSKQKLKLFSPRKPVDFHRIEMSISLVFP